MMNAKTLRAASLAALALFAVTAARADAAKPAPAAPPAAPPAPAAAQPTAPADGTASPAGDRAHIDAALSFLKALTHTSRKGDQGAQAWSDLKAVAADKVPLTLAGAHHDIDVAGKACDAHLVTFQKISTLREGKEIKGVSVELLDFKVGSDEHKGKGKILLSQTDGKWTVQSIEVE